MAFRSSVLYFSWNRALGLAFLTVAIGITHCSSTPSNPTDAPTDAPADDGKARAPDVVSDGGKSDAADAAALAQACASAIDVSAYLTNGKSFRGATSASSGSDVDCGVPGDPTQYLVLVAPAAGNYAFSVKPLVTGPNDSDAVFLVGDACGGGADRACQKRIAFLSGYVSFHAANEKVYLVAKGKALAAGYDLTFRSRGLCSDDGHCSVTYKPVCETTSGACVECNTVKDCTDGKLCDTSRRLCVECLTSKDCDGATGLTCDTTAGRCTCTGPSDCPADRPFCAPGPPSSCTECNTNADCKGPRSGGTVCGPDHTCECASHADCAASALGSYCGMHHASRPHPSCGCWESFDCPSSSAPTCISHECGRAACKLTDDVYDDIDDGPSNATVINVAVGGSVAQAHTLCSALDEEDWIRIPSQTGDTVRVRIDFTDPFPSAVGDITLVAFNEAGIKIGNPVTSSTSPVTLQLGPKSTNGAYLIQITGYLSGMNNASPQYLTPYTVTVQRLH